MSRLRNELRALRRAERALNERPVRRNPDGLAVDFHHGRKPVLLRGPRRVKVRALGDLRGVVYTTRKGTGPVTDYVHEFGERGGKPPVLAVDRNRNLLIVRRGSRYTITKRGIEG